MLSYCWSSNRKWNDLHTVCFIHISTAWPVLGGKGVRIAKPVPCNFIPPLFHPHWGHMLWWNSSCHVWSTPGSCARTSKPLGASEKYLYTNKRDRYGLWFVVWQWRVCVCVCVHTKRTAVCGKLYNHYNQKVLFIVYGSDFTQTKDTLRGVVGLKKIVFVLQL